jgi:hypothetical protein
MYCRVLLAVLFACPAAALLSCSESTTEPTGPSGSLHTIRVEGTATHLHSGQALSGWVVEAWYPVASGPYFTRRTAASTTTDEVGHYTLDFDKRCERGQGAALVGLNVPGHAYTDHDLPLRCTEELQVKNFESLRSGEPGLVYFGKVASSAGDPIPGAVVRFHPVEYGWYLEATTDTKGQYRLTDGVCYEDLSPYYLEASCGEGCQWSPERVQPTECYQQVNFVLEPVPPSASGR